jgi:predicted nuclease of predicted toxin-antitoxin system
MKILIDMNLSPLWVNTFAKRDIEAIHWASVGDRSETTNYLAAIAP